MVSGEKLQFKWVGLHYIAFSIDQVENKVLSKEKREQKVKISVLVTNFG